MFRRYYVYRVELMELEEGQFIENDDRTSVCELHYYDLAQTRIADLEADLAQGIEWNGMKERQLRECEARITKLEQARDLAAMSTATLRDEGIAKNERIKQLEAQLRNPEREPPHCPSCSCGLAAQPIYPDPDPIDVAPPCDISETPPHLRGPIIQAYADTNGVPPQSETEGEDRG